MNIFIKHLLLFSTIFISLSEAKEPVKSIFSEKPIDISLANKCMEHIRPAGWILPRFYFLSQECEMEKIDSNRVALYGKITSGCAEKFESLLSSEDGESITHLRIESPGGIQGEGKNIMEMVKNRNLSTESRNFCGSACTLIFQAGDQRILSPESIFMYHWGDVSSDLKRILSQKQYQGFVETTDEAQVDMMKDLIRNYEFPIDIVDPIYYCKTDLFYFSNQLIDLGVATGIE